MDIEYVSDPEDGAVPYNNYGCNTNTCAKFEIPYDKRVQEVIIEMPIAISIDPDALNRITTDTSYWHMEIDHKKSDNRNRRPARWSI